MVDGDHSTLPMAEWSSIVEEESGYQKTSHRTLYCRILVSIVYSYLLRR